MLSWTAAGAVAAPTMLQVRLTPRRTGRVAADAPIPERAMSDAELLATLAYFVRDRRGPRTQRVDGLVLSGLPAARAAGVARAVCEAQGWGLQRLVLHSDAASVRTLCEGPLGAVIDVVATPLRPGLRVDDLRVATDVHATAVLDHQTLKVLPALLAAARDAKLSRLTLGWPFSGAPPPTTAEAVAALLPCLPLLDGLPWGLKGLPRCTTAPLEAHGADLTSRVWRSRNRFYVDAAHQGAEALLFLPQVLRFAKRDSCRFCRVDGACDGVPARWLDLGLAGHLIPLE